MTKTNQFIIRGLIVNYEPTALHLFFTRLHPSTFPYSILVSHSGDEAVSIATTQELGVGALAPKLAEKDGLH